MSKTKLVIQSTWRTEHFDETASLLHFDFFISFVYLANDWSHLLTLPTHSPKTKVCEGLQHKSMFLPTDQYLQIIPWGGGKGGVLKYEIGIYICHAGYKNGRLRERPIAEKGRGVQIGP